MLSSLLAAQCPHTHSAYFLLPGTLVVTRPTAGYSAPSWLLGTILVTRRFPGWSSSLPLCALTEGTEWQSWSLLAFLAATRHPSDWHVEAHSSLFGTLLNARCNPCHWLPSWSLCALMATQRRAVLGHSAYLLLTGQAFLATRHAPATRCLARVSIPAT